MTNIKTAEVQSGFLLTRQVKDIDNSLCITLWVKSVDGPVKLEIGNQLAVFFIESHQLINAQALLSSNNIPLVKVNSLSLKTFNHESVAALYFSTMRNFYRARDLLKSHYIKCYEDDIRVDDRFLMERYITADIDYVGHLSQADGYQLVKQAKCRKAEDSKSIALIMLSIDIECSASGELYSIGLYANNNSKEFKRVLMIGELQHDADAYIRWVSNEQQLIMQFIDEVNAFDPDIIIGWNVINFDFMLLQKRCDFYGITFSLGRDDGIPAWRKNINNDSQNFIEIAGRVVLDGIDLLKTATYNFSSFSLENIAQQILGVGKKVNDVDNRLKEITHNFHHDKTALATYNLEDCRLVWLVFQKTQLLDFAQLRAQLTGLSINRVGGSVAAFTNLYLPKLHRSGYIAPNMGDGKSELVSPGGFVMDSKPGLYSNVLVLDFKSLYPSIIKTFKVDPMGLIEGLKVIADNVSPAQCDKVIAGFDGAYFSRTAHFLPDIIESLWLERDKAKRQNNAALSQAIKIIMNSFYGVLGSTGCRFFDPRLSGSITKRSHQILKETGRWIDSLGYEVIYGDTDSIFVYIGENKSAKQSQELGVTLQSYINKRWQKKLRTEFDIESKLDIEFETHFTKFFMPSIRGTHLNRSHNLQTKSIGTKKRYAGVANDKLIFKGLETVRSDWTELSKIFQQELYRLIFNDQPVEDYINKVVSELKSGVHDADLIYTKKIRRNLNDYVNTPPHIKAAILANTKLNDLGEKPKYRHRSVIRYVMTLDGVQPLDFRTSKLDYEFYVEKQLKPIADDILPFVDKDFESISGRQIGLF